MPIATSNIDLHLYSAVNKAEAEVLSSVKVIVGTTENMRKINGHLSSWSPCFEEDRTNAVFQDELELEGKEEVGSNVCHADVYVGVGDKNQSPSRQMLSRLRDLAK